MASQAWSRETWAVVLLVIAAVVLIPTLLFVGVGGGGMMGGGSYGGGGWVMGMGAVAVIGVVILLLILLVPGMAQPVIPPPYPHPEWGPPPSANPAVHILDERYARGEITRDEYVRMRQDLESRTP